MTEQIDVLDKLNDVPNITADDVFKELVSTNNTATIRLNAYVLAKNWNESDAVQFGLVEPKTAADFLKAGAN